METGIYESNVHGGCVEIFPIPGSQGRRGKLKCPCRELLHHTADELLSSRSVASSRAGRDRASVEAGWLKLPLDRLSSLRA